MGAYRQGATRLGLAPKHDKMSGISRGRLGGRGLLGRSLRSAAAKVRLRRTSGLLDLSRAGQYLELLAG